VAGQLLSHPITDDTLYWTLQRWCQLCGLMFTTNENIIFPLVINTETRYLSSNYYYWSYTTAAVQNWPLMADNPTVSLVVPSNNFPVATCTVLNFSPLCVKIIAQQSSAEVCFHSESHFISYRCFNWFLRPIDWIFVDCYSMSCVCSFCFLLFTYFHTSVSVFKMALISVAMRMLIVFLFCLYSC